MLDKKELAKTRNESFEKWFEEWFKESKIEDEIKKRNIEGYTKYVIEFGHNYKDYNMILKENFAKKLSEKLGIKVKHTIKEINILNISKYYINCITFDWGED